MKPTDLTETTLTSEAVFRGKFLTLWRDSVRLPDGHTGMREYVAHPGAVMIIPFLDAQTILFERQHRYPLRRDFIEIPAGKLEPGEAPLATAQRELIEETGYRAAQWDLITTTFPCIGYSNERILLYAARELTHVGAQLDHGEFLETFPLSLAEALAWVRDGRIDDTKTQMALLWWHAFHAPR